MLKQSMKFEKCIYGNPSIKLHVGLFRINIRSADEILKILNSYLYYYFPLLATDDFNIGRYDQILKILIIT